MKMMRRLAALALLAITPAAIQSARVSQAVTFPAMDLSCFASCTADPSQNSGDLRLLPGRQLNAEEAASAIATCADDLALDCISPKSEDHWDNTQQGERYFEATLSTGNNNVEPKAFDVMIKIHDWDVSRGPRSCTNLGDQADSPGEDCSNVEAGSDYTEAISVLTVAIIAMLALAVIPFAWVMHRSYRTWRLRRRGGAVGKYDPVVR
jgi:hypothetical protein